MKKLMIFVLVLMPTLVSAQNARSLFINEHKVKFATEIPVEQPKKEDSASSVEITTTQKIVVVEKAVSKKASEKELKVDAIKDKKTSDITDKVVAKKAPQKQSGEEKTDYAGLSYSIYKEIGSENFVKVTPNQVFETGDRIYVEVTTNKAGRLISGNIDPKKVATLLSVDSVKAHQPIRIPQKGALKFVGPKGNEKLVFILSNNDLPVTSANAKEYINECKANGNTRSIVVDDSVGNKYQLVNKDGSCPTKGKSKGFTRSIIVDVEEDSSYGVVKNDVLESGQLLSLIVNLKHK